MSASKIQTRWERALGPTLAVLGTGFASWWYAQHPDRLLLGTTPQETLVPWWYQATAFPTFGWLLSEVVIEPRHRVRRSLLVVVVSVIALVRLAGLIPLSGHATFLVAALAFSWRRSWPVVITALLGLAVTTVYKCLWGDVLFFSLSVLTGALIGVSLRGPSVSAK